MTKTIKTRLVPVLALASLLAFTVYPALPTAVRAEGDATPAMHLPGTVEGDGTNFVVTDSEYLNVTLTSDATIHLFLESIPSAVSFYVFSTAVPATYIAMTGFVPSKTYYRYQDGLLQEEFIADSNGQYAYLQDVSSARHVFILEKKSTVYINADGSVSPASAPISRNGNAYTLTGNIDDSLYILKSGITLDGAGYTVKSWGNFYCLYAPVNNTVIQNLTIRNCTYGLFMGYGPSNNTITNTVIADTFSGIIFYQFDGGGNNIFSNNTFISDGYGFRLYYADGNAIYRNAFLNTDLQQFDSTNAWDNGAGQGNYWSDYTGQDLNGDGVGDTAVPHKGVDQYPLMQLPFNAKPLARAGGPYIVKPGTAAVLSAGTSYDSTDALQYRWDFNNDGAWDTAYSSDPTVTHTWYANYNGWIRVEASDGVATNTDSAHLRVENLGNTLIADRGNNRVVEVDQFGQVVWQVGGFQNVQGAERIANGNTLVADIQNRRVVEINQSGAIVWQKGGFMWPVDVERLANGNTLVTDNYTYQIYEVNSAGTVVWQVYARSPMDADRLVNGNTLITDNYSGAVYEIDPAGNRVWEKTGLSYPEEADRLANGNTLVSGFGYIYEVDGAGTIVWQYGNIQHVRDADVLPNGDILFADESKGRATEIDRAGNVIWTTGGFGIPGDVQRLLPVYNTQPGTNVTVSPHPDVSITFFGVTQAGDTFAEVTAVKPAPDKRDFRFLGVYYNLTTTATYTPPVIVCLKYVDTGMPAGKERSLKMFHWDGSAWLDITSSLDTVNNIICGTAASFSWFGVAHAEDIEPPVTSLEVAGTLGNNDWYVSDVTVAITAADNTEGSGVAETRYSLNGAAWNTYNAPVVLDTDGIYNLAYYSVDSAGNIETVQTASFKRDSTAPEIVITRPEQNAVYLLNQGVVANWSVSDDGSGVQSATGTTASGGLIDTTTIGDKTYSVTATDNAGNTSTMQITYHVQYVSSGVLQPINLDGSSLFKLNRTIPVKFRAWDALGQAVPNITAHLYITKTSDITYGQVLEPEVLVSGDNDGLFRYDSSDQQYIYTLSTKGMTVGTYQLRIALDDGSAIYAYVSLR